MTSCSTNWCNTPATLLHPENSHTNSLSLKFPSSLVVSQASARRFKKSEKKSLSKRNLPQQIHQKDTNFSWRNKTSRGSAQDSRIVTDAATVWPKLPYWSSNGREVIHVSNQPHNFQTARSDGCYVSPPIIPCHLQNTRWQDVSTQRLILHLTPNHTVSSAMYVLEKNVSIKWLMLQILPLSYCVICSIRVGKLGAWSDWCYMPHP